jgi:hypothetical protein
MSVCAQPQGPGLWQRFKSLFTLTPTQKEKTSKAMPTVVGAGLGGYGAVSYRDDLAKGFIPHAKYLFSSTNPSVASGIGIFAYMSLFAWGGFVLGEIYRGMKEFERVKEQEQNDAIKKQVELASIQKIKNALGLLIINPLFYPTKSSKINLLTKKDEFLQYANDPDKDNPKSVLYQACQQLVEEINAAPYSDEQFAEDNKIGTYIAQLKNNLNPLEPLKGQINQLEKIQNQQDSIIKMRGFLSLYYRMQNQLEVEKKLTLQPGEIRREFLAKEKKLTPEKFAEKRTKEAMQAEQNKELSEMNKREIERLVAEKGKVRTFVTPEPLK